MIPGRQEKNRAGARFFVTRLQPVHGGEDPEDDEDGADQADADTAQAEFGLFEQSGAVSDGVRRGGDRQEQRTRCREADDQRQDERVGVAGDGRRGEGDGDEDSGRRRVAHEVGEADGDEREEHDQQVKIDMDVLQFGDVVVGEVVFFDGKP